MSKRGIDLITPNYDLVIICAIVKTNQRLVLVHSVVVVVIIQVVVVVVIVVREGGRTRRV